ncbi:hypothetical protein CCACVL1_19198 [Corchorus capsularis]|uniref:Uncharacterized protein n=1 Tax=Corchorus capsularis TaxID=210143 RepID=A0A1R3HHX4_COCAP|nr:hypothetical protein CCACVL1_19198 [Corchorus capsularis]
MGGARMRLEPCWRLGRNSALMPRVQHHEGWSPEAQRPGE